MRQLTTAVYNKLAGSALETALGGRLFEDQAPEGTPYPFAVYSITADRPIDTFTDKIDDVLIQFSLFSLSNSTGEIKDLYANLRTLYDGCDLVISGNTFIQMERVNMYPLPEDITTPEGTRRVQHYAVDYGIIQQR